MLKEFSMYGNNMSYVWVILNIRAKNCRSESKKHGYARWSEDGGKQLRGTAEKGTIFGPFPADRQRAWLLHTEDRNGITDLEPVVVNVAPLHLVGDLLELKLVAHDGRSAGHSKVVLSHSVIIVIDVSAVVCCIPKV